MSTPTPTHHGERALKLKATVRMLGKRKSGLANTIQQYHRTPSAPARHRPTYDAKFLAKLHSSGEQKMARHVMSHLTLARFLSCAFVEVTSSLSSFRLALIRVISLGKTDQNNIETDYTECYPYPSHSDRRTTQATSQQRANNTRTHTHTCTHAPRAQRTPNTKNTNTRHA